MSNKRELVYQIIIGFLILTNIGLVMFPSPAPEPIVYYSASSAHGEGDADWGEESTVVAPPPRNTPTVVRTPTPRAAARPRNTPTPGKIEPGEGVININTASAAELQRLPGVGPAIAQRIIEHRETRGPFTTIQDIMLVNGIGQSRFENIREVITI